MIKILLSICVACVLFFTSCSESTNSGIDLANGINFTMAGAMNSKYSSSTATAVTTTVQGKTVVILNAKTSISGKDVTILITIFGTTIGTYELTLQNITDPGVMCTVSVEDGDTYVSNTGKLIITEIGTSLGSKAKGTFNFHLYNTGLDKELNITSGTFNLIHVVN
jgi:hypothetical protein